MLKVDDTEPDANDMAPDTGEIVQFEGTAEEVPKGDDKEPEKNMAMTWRD